MLDVQRRKTLRVLVVDDNPMNLFVMKMLLEEIKEIDIDVVTAMNGVLAL